MLLLLDQGHSSHEYLHRVSGPQTAKIGLGVTFGVTPKTPQEARWRSFAGSRILTSPLGPARAGFHAARLRSFRVGSSAVQTSARRATAEQHDELAATHVWMSSAWQEKMQRAAQKSLAVVCPACSRQSGESTNRGLMDRCPDEPAGSLAVWIYAGPFVAGAKPTMNQQWNPLRA